MTNVIDIISSGRGSASDSFFIVVNPNMAIVRERGETDPTQPSYFMSYLAIKTAF